MALSQEQILEAIDTMTVLELSEFIKKFEERYGVTAAAPAAPGRRGTSRSRNGEHRWHSPRIRSSRRSTA